MRACAMPLEHGIRRNAGQFVQLLLQVLLVGLTIGMMRTVVLAFGLVKGVLNFVAGRLSERIGRKKVLLLGWLVALPIPVIVWLAPSWNWIVFATVLLGFNQGL